jgi:hypothetical protein
MKQIILAAALAAFSFQASAACIKQDLAERIAHEAFPDHEIERYDSKSAMALLRHAFHEATGSELRRDARSAIAFDANAHRESLTAIVWMVLFGADGCAVGEGPIPKEIYEAMTAGRGA